jgi:hypothetical protein
VTDEFDDVHKVIDLSEPKGPMELRDWAALYPTLPLRTVSLCLWEASNAARSHDSGEDLNAAVAWLVSARLEELRLSYARGELTPTMGTVA